jgi:hypothetical protein
MMQGKQITIAEQIVQHSPGTWSRVTCSRLSARRGCQVRMSIVSGQFLAPQASPETLVITVHRMTA